MHAKVARINVLPRREDIVSKEIPSYNEMKSCTMGERKGFILFGSLGPAIMPASITFSSLKRSFLGRFKTTKYMLRNPFA